MTSLSVVAKQFLKKEKATTLKQPRDKEQERALTSDFNHLKMTI